MSFINTNNPKEETTFEEAIIRGLPSMEGLWFPKNIDVLPEKFFDELPNMEFTEVAFQVFKSLTKFEFDDD